MREEMPMQEAVDIISRLIDEYEEGSDEEIALGFGLAGAAMMLSKNPDGVIHCEQEVLTNCEQVQLMDAEEFALFLHRLQARALLAMHADSVEELLEWLEDDAEGEDDDD